MVAGAKRASCWLACLAPLLCASKWFGEGCARVEDALVRPPKVILHPKSASPPKRWPSWPCLGWAVPHNRAFPRPILRRGLFHRPILRRGLCYARSREEGFVTPDPQNRALLRPIPTPGDPDPDAPIPRRSRILCWASGPARRRAMRILVSWYPVRPYAHIRLYTRSHLSVSVAPRAASPRAGAPPGAGACRQPGLPGVYTICDLSVTKG